MIKTVIKKYLKFAATAAVAVVLLSLPAFAEKERVYAEFTLPNGDLRTIRAEEMDKTFTDPENEPEENGSPEYAFMLPYTAKGTEITLTFNGNATVNGKEFKSGDSMVFEGGVHDFVWNGKQCTINIMYLAQIPQVYISMDGADYSYIRGNKGEEAPGKIAIFDGEQVEYNGDLEYIRGRGNSSWMGSKKPYAIKLKSKTSLFGNDAAKKYVLLANYDDRPLVKNITSYTLADMVGIPYNPWGQMVDLYINEKYIGVYTITEKPEVSAISVNIFNMDTITERMNPGVNLDELVQGGDIEELGEPGLKKWVELPNDMTSSMTGGFLLELELRTRWGDEKCGFVSDYGQSVVVKSPKYASQSNVEYISGYYQEMEDAILSDDGYNELGKHYSEYIDVPSFAKMYVFQEYIQNFDAGQTSVFMAKDINGKLVACSAWDHDLSMSIDLDRNGMNITNPENIWLADQPLQKVSDGQRTLFSLLYRHNDFRRETVRQWNEYFAPNIEPYRDFMKEQIEGVWDSAVADAYIWRGDVYLSTDDADRLYDQFKGVMRSFSSKRAEFLNGYFAPDVSFVQYCANGAQGTTVDKYSYKPGSSAVVLENTFVSDKAFLGWNTKADGSGQSYEAGDTLEMNEDVILYAQWEGGNTNPNNSHKADADMGFFAKIINWFKNLFK